ncbi:MAG: ABC transporter ATP-binding protein [Candidatus Velamenicoccus archaeovorus]
MLEVRQLVCGYGNLPVLHGMDFDLQEHGSVAILGANGAGKSTFLKALSRSLPVLSGTIHWMGENITSWTAWEAARNGIGYVPQESNVFPLLSVSENLELAADLHPQGRLRMAEYLERFPVLGRRSRQLAGTLSGGERQMVAVGMALLMGPRLLLLDEPTSGLAPLAVEALAGLVRDVIVSGVAVVWVVEQDPEIALEIVDRAYVMAGGGFVSEVATGHIEDRRLLEQLLTGGTQP